MSEPWGTDRGAPWEHDPGPPRNRRVGGRFAATPNHRALGVAVTGREAFRWHFGPMFYRGRLGDGAARVLVIGQEGAQDEALAGRAFVGFTGARVQHLLTHLGITRSYLFLNTFAYPIFGQYGGRLRWLAQDPASPIVANRQAVLDDVLARNDLRLVLAVGTAAKETVVTWVRAHGGRTGGRADLARADATVLGPRVRLIGILHPGGAAAGAGDAIEADVRKAITTVAGWRADDPGWLPPDPDGVPGAAGAFVYRGAPIPFRDLPYGSSWRLGAGGTASVRTDAQRGIRLGAAGADRELAAHRLSLPSDAAGTPEGYHADHGDLPYEAPRQAWAAHDRGPPASVARLLQGGVAGLPWPDPAAYGLPGDGSFGVGGGYRGTFHDVAVLVLADQESHDDVFCGRALCGDGGQHLEGVLEAIGAAGRTLIVRVLPADTLGAPWPTVRRLVDDPRTVALHRELHRRVRATSPGLGLVLPVGPQARRLVAALPTDPLPVLSMKAWRERGARADWQRTIALVRDRCAAGDLPTLRTTGDGRRVDPSFVWDGRRRQLPRRDLPYGSVRWRGTSGDRAVRPLVDGGPSPFHLALFQPAWVAALPPAPLSPAEQAAVAHASDLAP
jgi:uracil-DNA glycosylase